MRAGFELPRERGLPQLARDRPLRGAQRVLDELLRDRRATLHGPFVPDVRPDRAGDTVDVDAAVLVESLVLDVDDRVLDPRRDLRPGHEYARLGSAKHGEDRLPVEPPH